MSQQIKEEYPFKFTDGGKSKSKRPKQSNDCTVRALAVATNTPYDEAYDYLKKYYGRECSKGAFFPKRAADDQALGFNFKWISFPAIKGEKRMNPSKFYKAYPKGIYILKTARHVICVKDGIIYDSFKQYNERCIYGAWEVTKEKENK